MIQNLALDEHAHQEHPVDLILWLERIEPAYGLVWYLQAFILRDAGRGLLLVVKCGDSGALVGQHSLLMRCQESFDQILMS